MKKDKLFLIISFTLLLSAKIFGQAAIDIPLSTTDGTYTIPLAVGLDYTATNCIDTLLGENDLQTVPFPPPGIFEIRFDLNPYGCPGVSSYKDYRPPPPFPYTNQTEHLLWWQVASFGNPIEIQYDIPNYVFMTLKDQIGGVFLNLGPFTGQGTATIPGFYTNIFTRCLLIMDYWWVPVELTSFSASILQNEKAVQLNWTTATETNNSGFEIERQAGSGQSAVGNPSGDGTSWEWIGFVPGFGTTTEPKSYSFIDENVTTGTYKYRLKQIDYDGSFTYSHEIEVEVDFTPSEYYVSQNYPNPFNPSTTIKYSLPVESFVRINIYNALGEMIEELVSKTQSYGNYEVTWNAQNYSSGIYYYSFEVNSTDGSQSHREMKKIVFLK